jgi:hypothetical protein
MPVYSEDTTGSISRWRRLGDSLVIFRPPRRRRLLARLNNFQVYKPRITKYILVILSGVLFNLRQKGQNQHRASNQSKRAVYISVTGKLAFELEAVPNLAITRLPDYSGSTLECLTGKRLKYKTSVSITKRRNSRKVWDCSD